MSTSLQPILEAHNLVVRRQGGVVLQVEHLAIYPGEILAVIGPNGAGKSTLLLTLTKLLKSTIGQIYHRGNLVSAGDELAYRRQLALVLQDPLLVDATVYMNVATGLRFRRQSSARIKSRVEKALEHLGISHLKNRKANQLSGGEAQRVSLARALCIEPDILLLDEPFGALDAPTRTRLLEDFKQLLARTRQTTIFITHDMDEALALGDRVAVLVAGELRQIGPPEKVFSNPADLDVANLVGVETVLPGKIIIAENGRLVIGTCGIQIEAVGTLTPGQNVFLMLRPEDITVWTDADLPQSSARNRLSGQIVRMIPQNSQVKVVVECPGCDGEDRLGVIALVTRTSAHEMDLAVGGTVLLTFKASAVHLIPR